jgi:hypothetical protein
MSTIVTRAGKGSALTHNEVDANFTNLNTDKLQSGNTAASLTITSADINGGTIDGTSIGSSSASTGAFTTLSSTGNTTLGDASTDTVTVNGYMGVGGAGNVDNILRVTGSGSFAGANQSGGVFFPTGTTAGTAEVSAVLGLVQTPAAAYTASNVVGLKANNAVKGAGSTITNLHGLYVADQTQGTNNFGVTSLVSSGTNKWNIYASGTAANYFAGNVGIGTTSPDALLTVNTVASFGDGSASAPSIAHKGDLNTGIYFPAADTIGFAEGGAQVGEFDSSANFKFNSGYGSVATAYGCRAWVNFNGTANSNVASQSYSQTGTTVTVTSNAHGLITGNSVYLDFTSGTAVDGEYTVTVTGVNAFTVQQASRSTSGLVTIVRSTIRGSGNVSSVSDNGTGDYTVNFAIAMPDDVYAAVFSVAQNYTTYDAVFQDSGKVFSKSASSVRLQTNNDSAGTASLADMIEVSLSIFR